MTGWVMSQGLLVEFGPGINHGVIRRNLASFFPVTIYFFKNHVWVYISCFVMEFFRLSVPGKRSSRGNRPASNARNSMARSGTVWKGTSNSHASSKVAGWKGECSPGEEIWRNRGSAGILSNEKWEPVVNTHYTSIAMLVQGSLILI